VIPTYQQASLDDLLAKEDLGESDPLVAGEVVSKTLGHGRERALHVVEGLLA
jgi:hypothetical protein